MAYYQAEVDNVPDDVAIVQTPPGQLALWVNTKTSAVFANTDVTFTADLGPKVAEGQYAGTGNNGFHDDFTCWQQRSFQVYVYAKTVCSQVYDCNHKPAPDTLPPPLDEGETEVPTTKPPESTTGSIGTTSPTGTLDRSRNSSTPQADARDGLSTGALVAIIVGVVGTVLLSVFGGVFLWLWRRMKKTERERAGDARDGAGGAPSPDPSKDGSDRLFELDGQWYRIELAEGNDRYELDGAGIAPHGAEPDCEDEKGQKADGKDAEKEKEATGHDEVIEEQKVLKGSMPPHRPDDRPD